MKKCIEWGKKFLQVAFCASLIFALAGVTACSDDDDDDSSSGPTPKMPTPVLSLEDDGKITITNYAEITAASGYTNKVGTETKSGAIVVMVDGTALNPQPLISANGSKQQFTVEQKKVNQVVTAKATVAEGVTLMLDSDVSEAVTIVGAKVPDKPTDSQEIEIPESSGGSSEPVLIIKNKVQMFDSEDVYYEFLAFTSGTGGDYSLYKEDAGGTLAKQTSSVTIGDNPVTIPTTFTFTPSAFTISAGASGSAVTSYLFKNGNDYITATEKLTTTANPPALSSVWKNTDSSSEDKNTYTLSSSGDLKICYTDANRGTYQEDTISGFESDAGFISKANYPLAFYWTKVGSTPNLYMYAQKATEEEALPRALNARRIVAFNSSRFLLLK